MPIDRDQLVKWEGRTVVGSDDEKLGTVSDVYYDSESGRPEWVLVHRGFLGMKDSLVPVGAATVGDDIRVPYTKDQVKNAPDVNADGDLSEQEEDRLYSHYGVTAGPAPVADTAAAPTAPPTTARAEEGGDMVLSEEVADVGTVRRPRELVRMKKNVVTDHVTETVPVQREEIRVEREPVQGGVAGDRQLGEDEVVVTASEEEPVVSKHTEARERVRLEKDVETAEQQVSADVRREEVDVDRDRA